ncbi:MAG: hypothetical protein HYT21_00475 [Candidatus Nealsonbacteria bacterium]|nr:hypothetical protein [Candidatus Nealsonbacteria bacterium]
MISVFSQREKTVFFFLLFVFLSSGITLLASLYYKNTEIRPAVGGSYTEGMVGSPRFINPIYAASNDADKALTEVIFSGLMGYDEQGKIIGDAAQSVDIEENGKTYVVNLRTDIFWHDGKPLTADDVIFTIRTIQNPDYKSPLRGNYLGVEMEKASDYQIRFKLKDAYAGFLERLTFKILPKHIWEEISPQNFLLTNYNLQPIGSGPYQFKKLEQDKQGSITAVRLVRFKKYYSDQKPSEPYIAEFSFLFFKNQEELAKAARNGRVDGFPLPALEYWKLAKKDDYREVSLSLPRYFAIFFNKDQSKLLGNEKIRKALSYATDKNEIINTVLNGKAKAAQSPILPEMYGLEEPANFYEFNPQLAEELLTGAGLQKKDEKWVEIAKGSAVTFKSRLQEGSESAEVTALQECLAKDPEVYPAGQVNGYFGSKTKAAVIKFQEKYSDEILKPGGLARGTGVVSANTRAKLNELCSKSPSENPLELQLTTVQDPVLEKVALQIKEQWARIGIEISIQTFPISELEQEIIKPRNYQMLLFGEVLTAVPDPFPFWHSSQIKDPGLNLAKYQNSAVDKLLETARTTLDEKERMKQYQNFQNIIIEQAPALFLYNPDYLYMTSGKIKGLNQKVIFDPSQRFSDIENWYIKTKRIKK